LSNIVNLYNNRLNKIEDWLLKEFYVDTSNNVYYINTKKCDDYNNSDIDIAHRLHLSYKEYKQQAYKYNGYLDPDYDDTVFFNSEKDANDFLLSLVNIVRI